MWSLGAELEVCGSSGTLRLAYRAEGVSYAPAVELEAEAMRFGGVRWWARCPACSRRCAGLFVRGARVACRPCFRLAYRSTREDASDRTLALCQRLAGRLDPHEAKRHPLDTFPLRPKRMRAATYARIRARIDSARERLGALEGAAFAKFARRWS